MKTWWNARGRLRIAFEDDNVAGGFTVVCSPSHACCNVRLRTDRPSRRAHHRWSAFESRAVQSCLEHHMKKMIAIVAGVVALSAAGVPLAQSVKAPAATSGPKPL